MKYDTDFFKFFLFSSFSLSFFFPCHKAHVSRQVFTIYKGGEEGEAEYSDSLLGFLRFPSSGAEPKKNKNRTKTADMRRI